jgi:3-oxoacyl-[acyl-carrier-protein] synthase-1
MTAPATAAAVRAAVSGFAQHPYVLDTTGKPMVVAMAPYLDAGVTGTKRLAELAGPAAVEATAPLSLLRATKSPIPVFVGLPADRPGRAKDISAVADRVRNELAAAALRAAKATIIEAGHAAGAMALHAAWQAIRTGDAEFALAGGADSYTEPETLEWLEAHDQVHSAGFQNNGYGFVPGEAAAFVMLGSASAAAGCGLDPSLELIVAQTARETNLIKTDTVCTGEGLTALFRGLAAALPHGVKIDHLYCDLNGEPYRADEFGFAIIRAGTLFKDPSAFTAPADCWGDVGAASGPLYVVLADAAARKSYAHGPTAGAFTSSESGERCGFVSRARTVESQ